MRVISAIMNFYWSHAITFQKLSNEHSYKFNLILTVNLLLKNKTTEDELNLYWIWLKSKSPNW